MGRIGLQELLIILVILIVLFGASKLPKLGRGIGEGLQSFRKGLRGDGGDEEPKAPPPAEDSR